MKAMTMLREQIQQISQRFYTVEEFPFLSADRFSVDLIDFLDTLKVTEIEGYADSLSAAQLDTLLYHFSKIETKELLEKATSVVCHRLTKRLVKLFFSLYQHRFDSPAIVHLASAIAVEAQRKGIDSPQVDYLSGFANALDPFAEINGHVQTVCRELESFFRIYGIRNDSRLAFRIRRECFLAADSDSFLHNARQLVYHIDHSPVEELSGIITQYLSQVSIMDFHEGVNLSILSIMGEPKASLDWAPYPLELRTKFAQWVFLHRLKIHSFEYPQKYRVLSKYFDRIVESYHLEGDATLIIDFGDIVVADVKEKPYSYFYKRKEFDKEMARWRDEELPPAFVRMDRDQTTARDYIIEEIEGNCLQLRYEGVDFLYIEELMDIKMGLEPEFRRRKLKKKV